MRERATSNTDPAHTPNRSEIRDRFSVEVAASLEAGLVRYSRRRELLRLAGRMGLAPFEACLIIAEVQYTDRPPIRRAVNAASTSRPVSVRRRAPRPKAIRRRLLTVSLLTLVIIWFLLH